VKSEFVLGMTSKYQCYEKMIWQDLASPEKNAKSIDESKRELPAYSDIGEKKIHSFLCWVNRVNKRKSEGVIKKSMIFCKLHLSSFSFEFVHE
jgi:hypothetical protein